MKAISRCTSVCMLVFMFFSVTSAMATSFTAELVTREKGEVKIEKYYFMDRYYRMEVIEEGKPIVVIADKEKKIHLFLNLEKKSFLEIPSNHIRVFSLDPFMVSEFMANKYGSKVEGTEKINGIKCERQVIDLQGSKIVRWFSNELKFPVKIISYEGDKEVYVAELRSIKKKKLKMGMFEPPADFKQVEEPGAAERRKREKLKKQEEALPGLTSVKSTQAPCYEKIAAGGELRIKLDIDRKAFLDITSQTKDESEFTLLSYSNGKSSPKDVKLGYWRSDSWDFNGDFEQKARSFLVDEIRIQVSKGLIYARVTQSGSDRKDGYNSGGQTGHASDPKRPLKVSITGDNPFEDQTTGKFLLTYEAGGSSKAIPFKVENGKTLTWDYPADKGVKKVTVTISSGDGRAKITLVHPPDPDKAVAEKKAVKKASKLKYAPKAKPVTRFAVTHPYGTGKPLTPGKDLLITVTGSSAESSGKIILYTDRKKTREIDTFKFKLKKNQSESFSLPGKKNVGWASVWVHNGSFRVKLDQTDNAKTALKEKKDKVVAKPAPSPKKTPSPASVSGETTASAGAILDGEVPLMKGAKVLKTATYGANSMADLEVSAGPKSIINFYKKTMTARGWKAGMSMIQGNQGVLQLVNKNGQLMIKAKAKGQKSKISIALMRK